MLLRTEIDQLSPAAVVLTLHGRISQGSQLNQLQAQITKLIERGTSKVVLDMTEVDHIDSAALGMIIHSNGEIRTHGGELRIAGPQDRVRGLFKMTGTDQLLHIYPDKGSALAGFDS
jgi:anti-sigma B factor antagonist